jgi:O-antigen ligase
MKSRREKHGRAHANEADWPARLRTGVLGGGVSLVVMVALIPSEATIPEGTYAALAAGWCVLLIVWSLALWLDHRPALELGWTELTAAALIGWHTLAGMTALSSGNGRHALNSVWLYIGYGLTAFLLRQTLRTAAQVRALVAAMLWLATLLAALGLYQYFIQMPAQRRLYEANPEQMLAQQGIPTDKNNSQRIMFENRLRSVEPLATFALTNSLAGVLAPWLCAALAIALALRHDANQRPTLPGLLSIAVVLAGCLVLTKSRTAYLAAAAGLALVAIYCRPGGRRFDWRIPAALAGAAVVLGLAAVYFGGLDSRVLSESPKSVLYRLEYWRSTAGIIADHPLFGCGPGNFKQTYAAYKLPEASETISDPHNFLLEIWATSGTPAVILALLVAIAFAVDLSRAARRPQFDRKDSQDDADGELARRTIFGGALAGLILANPLSFVAGHPLSGLAGGPNLAPVVWLLGLPLLALCWWVFQPWIARGRLLLAALVVPLVVLLVNLLAAGAVAFPGVIESLLVLAPAALCLAGMQGSGAAAGATPGLPREFSLSKNAAAGLALAALALTIACLFTEYWPVLKSRSALERAMDHWRAGELPEAQRLAEEAALADPRDPEPWRMLAEMRLSKWLVTGAEADWHQFLRADAGFEERDPRNHLVHAKRGNWFLTAWRKSGRQGDLEHALAEYRRAIECYPNWAFYQAQLGWTLHLAGRTEEARAAAEAARRLDDQMPHGDKKLRVQKVADPQIVGGTVHPERPETAEQTVEQLRNTVGTKSERDSP